MRTRFAPSPTGPLHLGHAYSACLASDMARAAGGVFLLRMEDIDQSRARPEWETLICEDLRWLGLTWEEPVMRQSERLEAYREALGCLWQRGLLYPCTCTRRDIQEAIAAPQEGVAIEGPDGAIYPGTCRHHARRSGPLPDTAALRLDMRAALSLLPPQMSFEETGTQEPGTTVLTPRDFPTQLGDIVLSRRTFGTSYHLAVVVDDAHQNITHVIRGEDLREATAIHVVLQHLLALPRPVYHHHELIRDDHGKRLAKRDNARAIRLWREAGHSPQALRRRVGLGG